MKTAATDRSIRISRIIFSTAIAALLALLLAHAASAESPGGSIQHKVDNLIGACHFGGGSVSVNYEYDGDTLVSADVDCSGGDIDGYGCTFDDQTTVCSGALVRPPQNPLQSVTVSKGRAVAASPSYAAAGIHRAVGAGVKSAGAARP